MQVVNTRILHIRNAPGGESYRNTRKLKVGVIPDEPGSDTKLEGLDVLTTKQVWSLPVMELNRSAVVYTLIEPLYKNTPIAEFTIPLICLPPGTVVRHEFQMKILVEGIQTPYITVDLHIASIESEPFAAPPGELTGDPNVALQSLQINQSMFNRPNPEPAFTPKPSIPPPQPSAPIFTPTTPTFNQPPPPPPPQPAFTQPAPPPPPPPTPQQTFSQPKPTPTFTQTKFTEPEVKRKPVVIPIPEPIEESSEDDLPDVEEKRKIVIYKEAAIQTDFAPPLKKKVHKHSRHHSRAPPKMVPVFIKLPENSPPRPDVVQTGARRRHH